MGYPDFNTDPTPGGSGDKPEAFAGIVKEWLETLRNIHFGATPPSSPADGWGWMDAAGIYYRYFSGSWRVVADAPAQGSRDFGNFAVANFVLEQIAAQNATARLVYAPAGRMAYGIGGGALYDGGWPTDGKGEIRIPCGLNVNGLADPAVADTSTRHGGWLMDATTRRLNVVAEKPIPAGWTAAHDCKLEVEYITPNAETVGDNPSFGGDFRMIGVGEDVNKTGSPGTGSTETVTTSVANSLHRATIAIPRAAAGNLTGVGTTFSLELKGVFSGGAGELTSAIITRCSLLVPSFSARAT